MQKPHLLRAFLRHTVAGCSAPICVPFSPQLQTVGPATARRRKACSKRAKSSYEKHIIYVAFTIYSTAFWGQTKRKTDKKSGQAFSGV